MINWKTNNEKCNFPPYSVQRSALHNTYTFKTLTLFVMKLIKANDKFCVMIYKLYVKRCTKLYRFNIAINAWQEQVTGALDYMTGDLPEQWEFPAVMESHYFRTFMQIWTKRRWNRFSDGLMDRKLIMNNLDFFFLNSLVLAPQNSNIFSF